MSGRLGAYRYGFDEPARIAGTTEMMLLGGELPPGEPMTYSPISFLPGITTGAIGSGTSSDTDVWANTPSRVDLAWYQGDDVTIPLTIEDPADLTPDMSTQWVWQAQIRLLHTYHSTLVNTFAVKDEYFPPDADTAGFTQVTLFLPRTENLFVGTYRWDLYSLSPLSLVGFSQPPDVILPEPWPPTDQIRTWLYGKITIYPRVTATDILDDDNIIVIVPESTGPNSFFVGPNGRVP